MQRLGECENVPPSTSLEKEVDVFFHVFCKLCKLRNDKPYLNSKIVMFLREIDLKNIMSNLGLYEGKSKYIFTKSELN